MTDTDTERDLEQEIRDAFRVMVDARKEYRKKYMGPIERYAVLTDSIIHPYASDYLLDYGRVIDIVTMIADAAALYELSKEAGQTDDRRDI